MRSEKLWSASSHWRLCKFATVIAAVSILGAGNPNIAKVDISKMIDRSFMQSAQDRKLGG